MMMLKQIYRKAFAKCQGIANKKSVNCKYYLKSITNRKQCLTPIAIKRPEQNKTKHL